MENSGAAEADAPLAASQPAPTVPPAGGSGGPQAAPSLIVAVLLAGAGVTALARSRWEFGPPIRLGKLGPPSEITLALGGVVLLLGAYHAVVYGLGIDGYRLPMWAVAVVGPLIVAASFALDAIEHRSSGGGGP